MKGQERRRAEFLEGQRYLRDLALRVQTEVPASGEDVEGRGGACRWAGGGVAGAPDTFLRGTEVTLRVKMKRSRSFEMETPFRIMRASNGVETTSALTGRASVGRGAGLVQVVPERG